VRRNADRARSIFISPAESIQLGRREQIVRVIESQLHDRDRQKGLAGFRQIGQSGVQGEDRKPRFRVHLAAFVGVEQRTEHILS
jgi:hypothetical protein